MWYREGTINLTKGNKAVVGTGTAWGVTANGVLPGMILIGPDNKLYEIKSIESDTSLTLVEAYGGSTQTNVPCRIITTYEGDLTQFSARFTALMSRMSADSKMMRSWLTAVDEITIEREDGTELTVKSLTQIVNEHNENLEWYKENTPIINTAAQKAKEAAASATAAKKSETNSKASETASKTSETNAKNSEVAAKSSQSAAANSATAAKNSQDAAAESESAAAGSATSAAGSATAAANSQKAAKTSETNAKSSQTAAKTSETNAKASETAAKSSQDAAAQSESAAAGSASAAASSATASANSQKAAKTSETNAKASETAAANSAKASAASQTAAKASEDAAREYASQAAEPYKQVLQPLPDVWIPFNDSLDMITGFSPSYKKIVIGDDEITMPGDKVVKFKRASKATYINKSGVLTEAAIDEPRFERDGLLIEGQRTNLLLNSTNPSKWNKSSNLELTEISTDSFNFTYGRFTVKDTLIGQTSAISIVTVSGSKGFDVTGDEKYVTISCRVRSDVENIRCRLRFEHHDGSTYTFLGDAYLNLSTLLIELTGGAANRIISKAVKDEATGWIFFQATINALDTESMIGAMVQYAPVKGSSTVSGDYLDIATPQVEGGSSASSFILTDATATTRASDMVTIPARNNIYKQPISVLIEVNKNWDIVPNGAPRIFDLDAKSSFAEESFIFAFRGPTSTVLPGSAYVSVGSPSRGTGNNEVVNTGIYGVKIDKDGGLAASLNGNISSKVSTSWGGAIKSTAIRIGGQTTAGTRHLFGHIRNFRIWHKELTDAQMGESIK
ncbi:phage tail protein [Escherichia coli]|uniref:phage head spike fiber domain-containing protein n=1 Tax=Escherichia coli TaxID=562 RepID=UPI00374CABAD